MCSEEWAWQSVMVYKNDTGNMLVCKIIKCAAWKNETAIRAISHSGLVSRSFISQ